MSSVDGFSSDDELGSYEESKYGSSKNKRFTTFENKPYDEGLDVSQESSVAESSEYNKSPTGTIRNQKYDEAIDYSPTVSDKTADTNYSKNKERIIIPRTHNGVLQPAQEKTNIQNNSSSLKLNGSNIAQQSTPSRKLSAQKIKGITESKSLGESSSDEDDDAESTTSYENIEGAYDPKDYENLNVPADVKDLFQYIGRYKPHEIELGVTLKCFIPDYIPVIGDIDAFLKIPRPDNKPDDIGLKYLDEPGRNQSDPTVLELQLRATTKKVQSGDVVVRSIEDASKSLSAIEKWIQNISDLHSSKPPPQVIYKHNHPDIDTLMQVWPDKFEKSLDHIPLPSPDLDVSLTEYSKILCSLLDIPVYDNPVESLYVMFSLYLEFKNHPNFQVNHGQDMSSYPFGGADVMDVDEDIRK